MTSSPPPCSGLPPMDTKTSKPPAILPMKVASLLIRLFSSHASQRDPPAEHKTQHVRLITIAVSHFCEKARWGLDFLESDRYGKSPIYYTEDGHAPAFASFATLPASKNMSSATPMLVMADGSVIAKSDEILRKFCPFLYPEEFREEIMALEDELGVTLGAASRCAAYWAMLDPSKDKKYYSTLIDTCCPKHNASDIEHTLTAAMMDKGIDKGMLRALHINVDTAKCSVEEVRRVFAEISKRLESSKSGYLFGESFTAADLTFASLVYFMIHPPQMDQFVLPDSRQAPEFLELCKEIRQTTAGKHVMRMYSEHRPVDPESCVVVQKSLNRNCKPVVEMLLGIGAVSVIVAAVFMGTKK